MQNIVIGNFIKRLKLHLTRFINHLKQTQSLVVPYFFTVSAAWAGYYFLLHGVFVDLRFGAVPVAEGPSGRFLQFLISLDPMIFWANVVLSVIALVVTSIRSAWPVVLAWPIALALWYLDASGLTLLIAFEIACASSILRLFRMVRCRK